MCGIAGFAGAGDRYDLQRMTDALIHRGPDGEGHWVDADNSVFLGHRRLAIVDLEGGFQPMWTPDREIGVVFNGEIYNHQELRKELSAEGVVFQTDHSDTEVLLHGYRLWGEDLPSRLNGMWAFVIYDRLKRQLFCSRDRFGKKPFFYTHQAGLFGFASEITALAQHRSLSLSISQPAVKKYFAYGYIPAPHSIYAEVQKLPGGHSLTFDLDSRTLRMHRYWSYVLEPFDHIPAKAEEVWGGQLRDLLDKAVQRRLMSDVPLGTFLSGGIDSSAVTAFAARHLGIGKLNTFSMGFEEASFDESHYANMAAQSLNTRHFPEILSLEQASKLLPRISDALDEPMGDSSLLPTYLLSGHARKHVTVALGGDGADELFAGYDPFRALKWAELYHKIIPRPLHAAILGMAGRLPVSHSNMSFDFRVKRTLRGLSYSPKFWTPIWMATLDPAQLERLFGEPVDLEDLYSEAIEAWDRCTQPNLVDRTMQFYIELYLQDDILVKVDRASMMHSLEVRCPFLDIDLVDFARRIPNDFKYRHGETKYILKKALEPVLPREILYRPKKGFGVPIGKWFREGAFTFDPSRSVPGLQQGVVQERIKAHLDGRVDERAFLWNYWLLERFEKGCQVPFHQR
ncbi:MAG: asparagine synthase (glutamine-hydrolyzing) [Proteobacteria bacterium]|nr:asparagine synthase (glutamine-hydrolyzing) [Pseudomonadota bacterium]